MGTEVAISFSSLRAQLENEKSSLFKIDENIKKIVQTTGRFNDRLVITLSYLLLFCVYVDNLKTCIVLDSIQRESMRGATIVLEVETLSQTEETTSKMMTSSQNENMKLKQFSAGTRLFCVTYWLRQPINNTYLRYIAVM